MQASRKGDMGGGGIRFSQAWECHWGVRRKLSLKEQTGKRRATLTKKILTQEIGTLKKKYGKSHNLKRVLLIPRLGNNVKGGKIKWRVIFQ